VVLALCFVMLRLPWHEAGALGARTVCTGASHYGASLSILLVVGLAAVLFARTSVGDAPPWSQPPAGLVSGVVTSFAAVAALSLTATTGHEGTAVAIGKTAEMFRAFQWVLVALGAWQIWLHGSELLRPRSNA
jgi:hypothetical protein